MKGNLSESPEFGARWIQMSGMAPENPEVRAGTAEAMRGQVMLVLSPSPLRGQGLSEAPSADARISLHPEATRREIGSRKRAGQRHRDPRTTLGNQSDGKVTAPAWQALPLLEGT